MLDCVGNVGIYVSSTIYQWASKRDPHQISACRAQHILSFRRRGDNPGKHVGCEGGDSTDRRSKCNILVCVVGLLGMVIKTGERCRRDVVEEQKSECVKRNYVIGAEIISQWVGWAGWR